MAATVGWILIVLAVVGIFFLLRGLVREYRIKGFPVANGTMVSCKPQLGHTSSMPAKAGRRSSSPMWTVAAVYTYSVNGIHYEGHNISNIAPQVLVRTAYPDDAPPASIDAICNRYIAGTAVQVHFAPADPKRSYIYFTSPLSEWPWALFPLCMGLAGWLLIHVARLGGR